MFTDGIHWKIIVHCLSKHILNNISDFIYKIRAIDSIFLFDDVELIIIEVFKMNDEGLVLWIIASCETRDTGDRHISLYLFSFNIVNIGIGDQKSSLLIKTVLVLFMYETGEHDFFIVGDLKLLHDSIVLVNIGKVFKFLEWNVFSCHILV
jgi:hypothetical protein